MTDPVEFSDVFLASCVDEYVRRAITVVRQHGELDKETTRVEITASQYGKDGEYKVGHKVQVGDNYGSTGQYAQVCSDNAIRGANLAVMRLVTDMQSPPKSYTPLLTAPTPVTEQDNTFMQEDVDGDAAEFHPIEDQGTEQVSSFDDGPTGAN